ncbi:MAG: hypothetical protein Q9175_004750, partial [Cornicularia normoerica]
MARWQRLRKALQFWKKLTKATFERFIEWAYKGYYTAADFELKASSPPSLVLSSKEECETTEWMREPSSDTPPAEPEQSIDLGWRDLKSGKKSKKGKTRQELKALFICREYTVRRETISVPPTRANRGANEDYTE